MKKKKIYTIIFEAILFKEGDKTWLEKKIKAEGDITICEAMGVLEVWKAYLFKRITKNQKEE